MRLLLALPLTVVLGCAVLASSASAVIGGAPVPEANVPWFAELFNCGGALVAPDRILTAGHCVRGEPISTFEQIRVAGTVRRGVRFAMYPGWWRRNGRNVQEDVALIRLDQPVLGVPMVRLGGPLPNRAKIIGRGNTAIPGAVPPGWLYPGEPARGAEPRPVTDARCGRAYRRRHGIHGERFDAARMLCAIDVDGRPPLSAACIGDSGGPLYSGPDGAPVLHGVVSWGSSRCGADGRPTVFASVRRAVPFILAPAPAWAPVSDGPPVVTGSARPGRRLKCAVRSWSVTPRRVRFRWERWWYGSPEDWRSGPPEPVGTGRTYTVRRRDAGYRLSCRVTARNAGGWTSVPNEPTSGLGVPG